MTFHHLAYIIMQSPRQHHWWALTTYLRTRYAGMPHGWYWTYGHYLVRHFGDGRELLRNVR